MQSQSLCCIPINICYTQVTNNLLSINKALWLDTLVSWSHNSDSGWLLPPHYNMTSQYRCLMRTVRFIVSTLLWLGFLSESSSMICIQRRSNDNYSSNNNYSTIHNPRLIRNTVCACGEVLAKLHYAASCTCEISSEWH